MDSQPCIPADFRRRGAGAELRIGEKDIDAAWAKGAAGGTGGR